LHHTLPSWVFGGQAVSLIAINPKQANSVKIPGIIAHFSPAPKANPSSKAAQMMAGR
jgi:hypothetical protein